MRQLSALKHRLDKLGLQAVQTDYDDLPDRAHGILYLAGFAGVLVALRVIGLAHEVGDFDGTTRCASRHSGHLENESRRRELFATDGAHNPFASGQDVSPTDHENSGDRGQH